MTMPVQPAPPDVAALQGAAIGGPPPAQGVPSTPPPVGPTAMPMAPAPSNVPPTPPLPAQVPPDAKLKEQPVPEKITNPFTRTAALVVQAAYDQAARLSENLGEHGTNMEAADSATVHEMMHFSPYGTDAPRVFWQKHDEYLALAVQNKDQDPYAVAERSALDEVYPYRSKIALLDSLSPEEAVKRAEQLLNISHRQVAAGNPHDAFPSIVGPAGLPQTGSYPAERG